MALCSKCEEWGFGGSGARLGSVLAGHLGHSGGPCALTLPSRGRPTSGFACCRPPLMSNVRPLKPVSEHPFSFSMHDDRHAELEAVVDSGLDEFNTSAGFTRMQEPLS